MKILVTAAFGHQGKILIPKLAAAGFEVRAARGTPGREAEVKRLGASEVFVGDLSDPEVYARALDGCEAVYHIGPGAHPKEHQMGFAVIEAAKKVGIRHLVFNSALHTMINIIQHRYKLEHEEALVESDLNFTILKPCDYMMPDVYIAPVMQLGAFPFFYKNPTRKHSYISLEDLTDVTVRVLREGSRHYGASYELAGHDKLDPPAIANILSRVMGKEIPAIAKAPEDLLEVMWGTRNPTGEFQHQADILRSIMAWYEHNDFVGNPNVLEWLLGRKPISFEEFATKAYAELSAGKAL